jgi:hypothetical protein
MCSRIAVGGTNDIFQVKSGPCARAVINVTGFSLLKIIFVST